MKRKMRHGNMKHRLLYVIIGYVISQSLITLIDQKIKEHFRHKYEKEHADDDKSKVVIDVDAEETE